MAPHATGAVATEFVLGFAEGTADSIVDYVASRLEARLGPESVAYDGRTAADRKLAGLPADSRRFLLVRGDRGRIARTAERLGYLKPRSTVKEDGTREVELAVGASGPPPGLPLLTEYQKDSELFDSDNPAFWKGCEEAQLLRTLIEDTPHDEELREVLRSALPKEKQRLATVVTSVTAKLVASLRIAGVLEVVAPLHVDGPLEQVWKACRFSLRAPTDSLQSYFGWQVAFYFEWMNFFTAWLIAPAVVGFCFFLHIQQGPWTVDDHPYLPFYSLFVVLWAVLFIGFWDQHAAACAWKWGVYGHVVQDEVRPEFRGELVTSEVTGGRTKVRRYPYWKRLLAYLLSAVVTGAMLSVAFLVMICSLNLQGYIDGKLWWERPLHFETLAQLAEPGAIFDPNQTEFLGLLAFGPTVIHVIVIMMLNRNYRRIAEWLTDIENHRLEEDHENSLVLKRFFFEAFDCYIALFYVGFVQQDIRKLRRELIALYTVDSLRRIATETLIPWLLGLWTHRKQRKLQEDLKKRDMGNIATALAEMDADEYEIFDDYLEMVIEFGYVTLFAAAFPLAAALSVVCNCIEVRSDLWKLTKVYRRPPAARASGTGVWRKVVRALVVLSVFTNVMLFACSEQLAAHFPSLYREAKEKDVLLGRVASVSDAVAGEVDLVIAKGKGRWVVIIAVICEHLVYLIAAVVISLIPKEPEWVTTQAARLEWEKEEALREKLASSRVRR